MAAKVRYAVGLDLGSHWTRCVVCTIENLQLRFRAYAVAPAVGWQKGRIADQEALISSVRQVVADLEKSVGTPIESVVVGMGGGTVEGINSRGLYEFGRPREVVSGDLAYAVELAARLRLEPDRLLLQVFPQDFTIDGRAGYRNPRGTTCSRLEANVHLVTASVHDHATLVNVLHQAHLAVDETVFEPVAAAYACVLQQERARGVALIDIGAQSTDVVIYDGDALRLAASLPICSEHFTKDVAFGLMLPYEDAEQLKQEYGCAILGLTSDHSIIEIPSQGDRPPRETTRRQLSEILEARAEELFYYVRGELVKVGMEQSLLEGVFLTGGGALLNGLPDMAERVLNCQVRNGLPQGIDKWPDELNTASWSVVAGLAMYSARLHLRKNAKRGGPGLLPLLKR